MDGAMGTELQKAGVHPGECFEHWNLTHPERVRAVHQAYADAGSRVFLTNTFQANPVQLQRHDLLDQGQAICQSAVALARSAAGTGWVLGDIGPVPEQTGGVGFPRRESLLMMSAWLRGVDAILLETCSDWSAWQALAWLRDELPDVPILISFTFGVDPAGNVRTWDQHTPDEVARLANEHKPAWLGVNCGALQDMGRIRETIRRFRQATDLPLFARPNAGTPRQVDGHWIYPCGAFEMASMAREVVDEGIRMLGGCCGTTPEHIAAFREALDE